MSIKDSFSEAQEILNAFISSKDNLTKVTAAGELLVSAIKAGNKIISCGNGGSMCDAMHFAEELSGRFREDRPALPAVSISDPSHITCVGNDYGFDFVFSRYIESIGSNGDVLLAISTSGNSPNVIKACEYANSRDVPTIAFTGFSGGKLKKMASISVWIPVDNYGMTEDIHQSLIHIITQYISKDRKSG